MPLVVLFVAPEPTSQEPVLRLDSIHMLGRTYGLRAVTFLAQPRDIHSSGHYTCAIKTETEWIQYGGLKRKCILQAFKKFLVPMTLNSSHLIHALSPTCDAVPCNLYFVTA